MHTPKFDCCNGLWIAFNISRACGYIDDVNNRFVSDHTTARLVKARTARPAPKSGWRVVCRKEMQKLAVPAIDISKSSIADASPSPAWFQTPAEGRPGELLK